MTTPIIDQEYLKCRGVLDRYGISRMTLDRWLKDPETGFPQPIRIKGQRYFSTAAIEQWEEAQASDPPTAQASQVLSPPIETYEELITALRARRHELGLSNNALEDRSGLQEGYVTKLENYRRPYGRCLGPVALPLLLGGLDCRLMLIENI